MCWASGKKIKIKDGDLSCDPPVVLSVQSTSRQYRPGSLAMELLPRVLLLRPRLHYSRKDTLKLSALALMVAHGSQLKTKPL